MISSLVSCNLKNMINNLFKGKLSIFLMCLRQWYNSIGRVSSPSTCLQWISRSGGFHPF
jgi:hypothetical protein